jgi:hypothetical protein
MLRISSSGTVTADAAPFSLCPEIPVTTFLAQTQSQLCGRLLI